MQNEISGNNGCSLILIMFNFFLLLFFFKRQKVPLSGLGWPPTQGPLPQPPGVGETARMHHYVTQKQASLLLKLRHSYVAFKLASLCFPALRGGGGVFKTSRERVVGDSTDVENIFLKYEK